MKSKQELLWYDRKRIWCGLPFSFTRYGLDSRRFFLETGFLNKREAEVRLYRVLNINTNRSFGQRIFGLGTIHVDSNDLDLKSFDIKNIKHPEQVKEMLSDAVEAERLRNRVSAREYMSVDECDENDVTDDHDELDDDQDDDQDDT